MSVESEPLPRLLTVTEAAEVLRVRPGWLNRAAARGVVPGRKVARRWMFTPADLNAYVEGLRADPWARSAKSQAAVRSRRRAS